MRKPDEIISVQEHKVSSRVTRSRLKLCIRSINATIMNSSASFLGWELVHKLPSEYGRILSVLKRKLEEAGWDVYTDQVLIKPFYYTSIFIRYPRKKRGDK